MGPALQTVFVAGPHLLEMLDLVRVTQVDLDVQPGHLEIGRAVHYFTDLNCSGIKFGINMQLMREQ